MRDAFELVLAFVGELDRRSGDKRRHGRGNKHAAVAGSVAHSSGDGDRDSSYVVAANLDLAGVKPGPEPEAEGPGALVECDRASDGASGPIERRQVTVAG